MKSISLSLIIIFLLNSFTANPIQNWSIGPNYSITFKGEKVDGKFEKFKGSIIFNESDISNSRFEVSIDVNSINTGFGMKTAHAKSKDWFEGKTYPEITFKSTSITKSEQGYQTTGLLKMKGVEKQILIPFVFEANTFKGKFKLNRLDYNIGTMKGMSKVVSNEIEVSIVVPVIKAM
jgi:polyisoprenoid-binding protein YceI